MVFRELLTSASFCLYSDSPSMASLVDMVLVAIRTPPNYFDFFFQLCYSGPKEG
nr:MAG TPA: hypothetical protein [Caudoviricetes sp.]